MAYIHKGAKKCKDWKVEIELTDEQTFLIERKDETYTAVCRNGNVHAGYSVDTEVCAEKRKFTGRSKK